MSEQDKQAKGQQEETGENAGTQPGETGADEGTQQDGGTQQEKSAVNKAIDKAQEKGLTDKAANMVKNKFKGR